MVNSIIEAKINTYGGQSSYGSEPVDVLEVTIPDEAFRYGTGHRLIAEAIINPLHLLKDDYDRMKYINAEIDAGKLDTNELEDALDEINELGLTVDDLDSVEVYDEMENYPGLCEMIADAIETLAHRLVKPVCIPLSDCGGEDLTVEPADPYDEEDHSFDDSQIIEGVRVEII